MEKKSIIKMIVDILMLVFMLLEYSKIYTGQLLHEIFGIILLMLFIIHNILNINFYKVLFKGKYNLIRIITTIVNFGFLLCMLLTIILGIPISSHVFRFLGLDGNMTTRKLHTILGYWGLTFLSIHLGLHFKMMFAKLKHKLSKRLILKIITYILEIIIIIFGIRFMINTNLWEHLIGEYSFGSFEGNLWLTLFKNFIIIISIGLIVYDLENLILWRNKHE